MIRIFIICLALISIANTVYIRYIQKKLVSYKRDDFHTHGILSDKIDRAATAVGNLTTDIAAIKGDMSIDDECRRRLEERVTALEDEKITVEKLAQEASNRYQAEVSSLLGYSGIKSSKGK